jgi:major membrane immunogen (membrane-anchored lipoprotein)
MRKVLMTVSVLALFALTACGKKEATCENAIDNAFSLMSKEAKTDEEKEMVKAIEGMKGEAVTKCKADKPPAEALSCAANAKTVAEMQGCKLPGMDM